MKFYVPDPDKDETIVFDLPDDAECVQVGAACPTCGDASDRRLVAVDRRAREFWCSPDNVGRAIHTKHDAWPRIVFRSEGADTVKVYEGDAAPFVVHGVKVDHP